MRDALGPGTHLGYCTNVHAGTTLDQVCANLERHAAAVRRAVCPDERLGIGLWLAQEALSGATFADFERLRRTLDGNGLYVFTLNGFPYGDFHGTTVKHAVYRPDWTEPQRFEYTVQLALRLASLSGGTEAGISTLPVGWKGEFRRPARLEAAAHALRRLATALHELHERHGYLIHVDIEPEPGCVLETSRDVVDFFGRYLLCEREAELVRRHLRVCHDVCHAAVMFEPQTECLARYAAAGIGVGKVQVSSGLRVRFEGMDGATRAAALRELARFVEPRFLHQTVVAGAAREFHADLTDALGRIGGEAGAGAGAADGEWRTHFHVPVFLERIGPLETTRPDILEALRAARRLSDCRHFEVETYAWDVLPSELRPAEPAAGIARELNWVRETARREGLA